MTRGGSAGIEDPAGEAGRSDDMEVPAAWSPPDEAARRRILNDLDTNLLVEAGAGSGKTTSMVGRMVELVRSGRAEAERIAAVTFTRKAAAELQERYQERLEWEYRVAAAAADRAPDSAAGLERERIARALDTLHHGFVGTIHGFCARLLRERPLEAGIPPDFQEISGVEEDALRDECWNRFQERLLAREGGSRLLRRMDRAGLRPVQLEGLFREVSDNPDVRFTAPPCARPSDEEIAEVRSMLDRLLDDALALLPPEQPEKGWDDLQKAVLSLHYCRSVPEWAEEGPFLEALVTHAFGRTGVTQNRWGSDKARKRAAKELGERWSDFTSGGRSRALYLRWLAHRYPVALRCARTAAAIYASERRRAGRLNFHDLLMLTARLLRTDPDARRDLGERYRFLLVDEFQDTDPIQAELIFLLASEPEVREGEAAAGPFEGAAWSRSVPRAGALFLVGDPKQSIYRFRRADISLYSQVRDRFREIGAVLELTANFRSTEPVARLVGRTFEGPLPPIQSRHQAAFAPLTVRPGAGNGAGSRDSPESSNGGGATNGPGVFWYRFEPEAGQGRFTGSRISAPDAPRIASWIRSRLERGERTPGDFMILTRTKAQVADYGRALEMRNIPAHLSGSGVGVEEELDELVLLLRALCDPGDPVLTTAVLEGLFFGLSHDELYRHVAAGGSLSCLQPSDAGVESVTLALDLLRDFWRRSRKAPADLVVGGIVERLGILPHAAAGELGSTRAAALLYALDALRVAGQEGVSSLHEAVEVLEVALAEEVDAPLDPGNENAVRVMNLHKAKGLEAPVVILVYPAAPTNHAVTRHIARDAEGRATGHLLVRDSTLRRSSVIARPLDWEEHQAAEAPFAAAEEVRLAYVAATRAAEELVIARCTRTEDSSVWQLFHEALDDPEIATELDLAVGKLPPRERLEESGEAVRARAERVASERRRLDAPSYRVAPVTTWAKGEPADDGGWATDSGGPPRRGRGVEWGTAVHRALELAAKGLAAAALRRGCRDILIESERPQDDGGEPIELDEIVKLVGKVTASPIWERARSAERVLVEVPFSVSFSSDEMRALGLDSPSLPAGAPVLVDGTIDLAFRERDGWVIVDYKSDTHLPPDLDDHPYRRQVDLYAACLARILGEPVREGVVYFTAHEQVETWPSPAAVRWTQPK